MAIVKHRLIQKFHNMGYSLPKDKYTSPKEERYRAKELLRNAVTVEDYSNFYTYFKSTSLPYIPCEEKKTLSMHQQCFEVLEEIGQVSIPVAVALSMHYYILATIASYPLAKTSTSFWKRELLLNKLKKEKALIANTGSVRTYNDATTAAKISASKVINGYRVHGKAPFMSLSGIADYQVFTAGLAQGKKAIFFAPSNTDQITFGEDVFGDTMLGSFTKSVTFNDLEVAHNFVIALEEDTPSNQENASLVYQRAWFQSLGAAPYLGGAYAVIEHLKAFGAQKHKNGNPLANSEYFQKTVGSLIMKYKGAKQLAIQSGTTLANFRKADRVAFLKELFEASVLAKYYGTQFAEEIITQSRQIMGTSFLKAGSFGAKVSRQITFGAAQPMTNPDIIDYFAKLSTRAKNTGL